MVEKAFTLSCCQAGTPALLLSIAWCCFFHHTSPGKHTTHAALISISILIHSDCHGSVYLLAGVCGDSQAIGHEARCFVLLHQPHRSDRDSHLDRMEKGMKIKTDSDDEDMLGEGENASTI